MVSSSRQFGFGPNPILLSDILAYCQIAEMQEPDEFLVVIKALDAAWIENWVTTKGS